MAGGRYRRFDRALKVAALARTAAGANVSALSRELGVRHKLLDQWRDRVRRGGVEALRGVGRPRAGAGPGAVVGRAAAPPAGVAAPAALAQARQQSATLERKIGQQALELDFFEQALRLMQVQPITRRRLTVPRNLEEESTLQRILRDSGLKGERDRD